MSDSRQAALDGKLRLAEGNIAPALIDALSQVIAYARSRILAPNADAKVAVHEHRKSLRRARSLVRMLRPSLSKTASRKIEAAMRDAHKQYAAHRDADARYQSWSALSDRHSFSVPEADVAFAKAGSLLLNKPSPILRKPVDESIALLAARLDPEITSDALRRGLRATFKSSQRALQRIRNVADPTHVHALRRRAKDLQNQLELIESLSPKRAAKWRKAIRPPRQEARLHH